MGNHVEIKIEEVNYDININGTWCTPCEVDKRHGEMGFAEKRITWFCEVPESEGVRQKRGNRIKVREHEEANGDILTKRLHNPLETNFVEKVLSKYCDHISNISGLMGE